MEYLSELDPIELTKAGSLISKSSSAILGSAFRATFGALMKVSSCTTLLTGVLARKRPLGMPMKQNLSYYWKHNIYETTTGNFCTELLDFHRTLLGPERILYSVDYPFVMMQQGADWVKTLPYSEREILDLIRNNAIRLLRL